MSTDAVKLTDLEHTLHAYLSNTTICIVTQPYTVPNPHTLKAAANKHRSVLPPLLSALWRMKRSLPLCLFIFVSLLLLRVHPAISFSPLRLLFFFFSPTHKVSAVSLFEWELVTDIDLRPWSTFFKKPRRLLYLNLSTKGQNCSLLLFVIKVFHPSLG